MNPLPHWARVDTVPAAIMLRSEKLAVSKSRLPDSS